MRNHLRTGFDKTSNLSHRTRYVARASFLIGLFLAIAALMILVLFSYNVPFIFLMLVFLLSIAMFFTAAALRKTVPILMVVLIGLGLAVLSFAYQPLGPESKMVGTECRPIRDCFLPVRGGGFPVQYVIDNPGITFWGVLGFEDEFRLWPFLADTCFYICMTELIRRIIQFLRSRGVRLRTKAG
jgi:hypothetical protein